VITVETWSAAGEQLLRAKRGDNDELVRVEVYGASHHSRPRFGFLPGSHGEEPSLNTRLMAGVRQEIPIRLLADEERRTGSIRWRTWLRAARGNEMWHGGYCRRRKEDLGHGFMFSLTSDAEETGALGPASGLQSGCELFAEYRNEFVDPVMPQRSLVP